MLPPEAIKQFKDLYHRHYNVEISDVEASLRANNLINLYWAVYGDGLAEERASPDPEEKDEVCSGSVCKSQD